MKVVFLLALCLVGAASTFAKQKPPTLYSIPLPPKPDFSALDWLVGQWAGKTVERSAPGEIRLSAAFDLDKQVIVLRGEAALAATAAAPASKESWLGILSAGQSATEFILRTFSSTGFITRFRVTVEGPEIRFIPEGGEQPPPGWLFRRVIQRTGVGEFKETVQVAPPTKPFFDYYTAKLHRVNLPEKSNSGP